MTSPSCIIENVYLKRSDDFSLDVTDFEIPKKGSAQGIIKKIPILGVSGAGKSTLLNIMAGIEWPDRGSVSWSLPDQNELIEWNQKGRLNLDITKLRRNYFGFAFQDSTLTPYLRIYENLSYPLRLKGFSAKASWHLSLKILKKVLLWKEETHCDDFMKRFPSQLSGGQRQRFALAQAFIHDPAVIFADEPTGSLDKETRDQVMKVLFEWVDEEGKLGQRLLIWVTHHNDDPMEAGVKQYINVDSGKCKWIPV